MQGGPGGPLTSGHHVHQGMHPGHPHITPNQQHGMGFPMANRSRPQVTPPYSRGTPSSASPYPMTPGMGPSPSPRVPSSNGTCNSSMYKPPCRPQQQVRERFVIFASALCLLKHRTANCNAPLPFPCTKRLSWFRTCSAAWTSVWTGSRPVGFQLLRWGGRELRFDLSDLCVSSKHASESVAHRYGARS